MLGNLGEYGLRSYKQVGNVGSLGTLGGRGIQSQHSHLQQFPHKAIEFLIGLPFGHAPSTRSPCKHLPRKPCSALEQPFQINGVLGDRQPVEKHRIILSDFLVDDFLEGGKQDDRQLVQLLNGGIMAAQLELQLLAHCLIG